MATETTNYKFKKPDNTDFYNIADQNGNWDKCDKQLKALDDGKAATTHEHTKAEITDFPTKLPADGGNAATVGGKSQSQLIKYDDLFNYTDGRLIADVLDINKNNFDDNMRIAWGVYPTSINIPPGVQYGVRLPCIAYDKNGVLVTVIQLDPVGFQGRVWTNLWRSHVNEWTGWRANDDKVVKYDANNLATISKLGGVNGGRLAIQKGDSNFTLSDVYVDYYDDSVRFWSARGGLAVGAKMKISDIPDTNFRNVALFTAGTTDITPGVTNLGKNQLYIKYKA